jgi:hypothetical protein
MAVPNIFGTATSAIPLSQLDTNFATPVTIGNTAVQLGNTVTSFGNVTLTNVTISSGNVTVSAGSNTAPSITTVGDTNTGIFFPAADTIAFSEGGVEAMRIDSSGNVGIGTTSPSYRIDAVATDGIFKFTKSGNASGYLLMGGTSANFSYDTSGNYAWAVSSSELQAWTAGTKRMVIDASGNVGIGVTPQTWTVYKPLSIAGVGQNVAASGGAGELQLTANCYYNGGWKYATTQKTGRFAVGEGYNDFKWFQAASGTADTAVSFTQAMTLDTSGNLLVGTTSDVPRNFSSGSGIKLAANGGIEAAGSGDSNFINITSASGNMLIFRRQANTVGIISTNGTNTTYGTSSDYRLKENIALMTGALEKVAALKPCTYVWKATGEADEGFIAHELAEVAPYAVSGEKDGEQMQGVDYGKLTPILTAALQEAIAKIEVLEARIAALEAK